MYYTYGLYNKPKNKIYIGQTNDLKKRLARHNGQLLNKHTSYTYRNKGGWIIVHKEAFFTRREAIKREQQLKTQKGREFIWNIIK